MWKQTGGKKRKKKEKKEESEPRKRGSPGGPGGLRQTVRAEPGDRSSSLHLLKQYNNSFLSHPLSKGFYCDGPSLPPLLRPLLAGIVSLGPGRNYCRRRRTGSSLVSSSGTDEHPTDSFDSFFDSSTQRFCCFFILIACLPSSKRNENCLGTFSYFFSNFNFSRVSPPLFWLGSVRWDFDFSFTDFVNFMV